MSNDSEDVTGANKAGGQAPTGPYRVACPFCDAAAGDNCTTRTGRPTDVHKQRWSHYGYMSRASYVEVRLRIDDPRFGLAAGETFYAIRYAHDTGKVTLLERVEDGVVPGCNQYVRDVEWVRWVPSHEVPHLPW